MRMNHRITVRIAVDRYLRHLKRKHATRNYQNESKKVLGRVVNLYGEIPICEITRQDIHKMAVRVYRKVQPNTYSNYARIWALFFERCKESNLVLYNWVQVFELPYYRTKAFFDSYQLDFIFSKLEQGELRDACLILYHTGISKNELDSIVRSDQLNQLLILKDRRISCPEHIAKLVTKRRFYKTQRVGENFRAFIKQFDFTGTMRFISNSYVVRQHLAGTPVKLIRRQLGFSSDIMVQRKIMRLTATSKEVFRFQQDNPFHDYH